MNLADKIIKKCLEDAAFHPDLENYEKVLRQSGWLNIFIQSFSSVIEEEIKKSDD